jgi:phosphoribosylglycinamide formyltransferase 1
MSKPDMLRLGVLISGRGSNLQALIEACAATDFPARIALVISNKADAYGLERAKAAGLASQVISHRDFTTREDFDAHMTSALRAANVELVCLAGFMRILSAGFVQAWDGKLINIHPSLLPSFKGLHTHERAIEAGCKLHGCTVHFVEPELDEGPIILQAAVDVLDDDTAETLGTRVLEQEHLLYPRAVRLIAEGCTEIDGMRVRFNTGSARLGHG